MTPRVEDGGSPGGFALPRTDHRPRTTDLGPPASGLFLHASSVVVGGGAFLFLGHSTAGKSTIARLLGKSFPVVADDAVYAIRGADDQWRVVDGSFRFGRDTMPGWPEEVRRRAAGAGAVRLKGCLRIHKAETARVEPLAPVVLARYLMDAAMEIDQQRKFGRATNDGSSHGGTIVAVRQMRRHWFHLAGEIARTHPGWHLWFAKDVGERELGEILSQLAPTI